MIAEDLEGRPIAELATRANSFYLGLFYSILPVWEDQYGLMGNPQVWSANGGLTDVYFIVEDVMRVIMAGAAQRVGYAVDPVDIDPLTFRIAKESPAGPAPGAGREETIAHAGELLRGLWHRALPVRP